MKKRLTILFLVFVLLAVSIIVIGPSINAPYRGWSAIQMGTAILALFIWMAAWILPGLLLHEIQNGKKIYFMHLASGILFFMLGLFLFANRPQGAWDFGNVYRGIAVALIYAFWGFGLLIYSYRRRKQWKREQAV